MAWCLLRAQGTCGVFRISRDVARCHAGEQGQTLPGSTAHLNLFCFAATVPQVGGCDGEDGEAAPGTTVFNDKC